MKRKEYRVSWTGCVEGSTVKHAWGSAMRACIDALPAGSTWYEEAKSFYRDQFGNHVGGCWHWADTTGRKVYFQITKMNQE